jgi:hypothetical protein
MLYTQWDKEWNGMCIHNAIKKNEVLSFATKWMELEDIMLSEINQTQKDKYYMFSLIYGS